MNENNFFKKFLFSSIKFVKWGLIVITIIYLFSGTTIVKSDEVAIILRFGKLLGNNRLEQIRKPGICFAFPNIIDEVIKIQVGKVKQIEVNDLYSDSPIGEMPESGYAITGDSNLIQLKAIVKYKIDDPIAYVKSCNNIENTIYGIVTGELSNYICKTSVDEVLTTKKVELISTVTSNTQYYINNLNLGILIENIEIIILKPPNEVKDYFDQVTSAYVTKETIIQEANQYKKKMLPKAEADYDYIIKTAYEYNLNEKTEAKHDVAIFYGLLNDYKSNEEIVISRIYLEKVSNIINKAGKKIVLPDGETTPHIIIK